MRTTGHPSRSISGVMLGYFMLLIPIALMSAVLLLTRVEVMLAETSRHQARAQARLLAQSVLTIHQTRVHSDNDAGPVEEIEGELEGIGRYELSVTSGPSGERLIVARGETVSKRYRVVSELRAVDKITAGEPIRSALEIRSQTVKIVNAN